MIVHQFEQALQTQKSNFEKMQNENQMLRSVNEREKKENHLIIDQLKIKHDIELGMIRRERDSLRSKLQESNQADINKIKDAIRENNQLKIKVTAFSEENEELREKLERAESQNSILVRSHSKALSEYSTRISLLEVHYKIRMLNF